MSAEAEKNSLPEWLRDAAQMAGSGLHPEDAVTAALDVIESAIEPCVLPRGFERPGSFQFRIWAEKSL